MLDLTSIKAHVAAAGQKSNAAPACLGHSRGGFGTKVHAVIDALDNCVHVDLTVAERADCALTDDLLAVLPAGVRAVVADKGYDANALIVSIEARAAEVVIPTKRNRKKPLPHDENL